MSKLLACIGVALAALGAGRVEAETGGALRRVHFLDGRTMDVTAYHVEATDAVLTLAGGVIAVPVAQVTRVEDLASPLAPSSAQPVASIPQGAHLQPSFAPDAQPKSEQNTLASAPESESQKIDRLIREAASRYDLEVDLISAVVAVESGRKVGAVSPKGAQGLMQLMPATAKDLAVSDPFDPAQNIDAGARYLRQLLDLHQDSYTNALAAYNAGAGRVARWKGVPPYKETQRYVHLVLQHYASPARH